MSEINAEVLRSSLSGFTPDERFSADDNWLAYQKLYALAPLVAGCHYSVGKEDVDDITLVVQYFRQISAETAKGTLILVHGYMDHMGLYSKLIQHVLEQEWDLLCFDLPGHGLSSGASYAIDDFSQYAGYLETLIQKHWQQLQAPFVLMGQSTGGAIILEHQRLYSDQDNLYPVAHRLLLAPLIRPVEFTGIQMKYQLLHYVLKRVKRYYAENSHDPDFLIFIREKDPLQQQWISVSWIGATLKWVRFIEASEPLDSDITVIQGTGDNTVAWEHNLPVLERIYTRLKVHLIEDGRHHLANEGEHWRLQVFDIIGEVLARQGADKPAQYEERVTTASATLSSD